MEWYMGRDLVTRTPVPTSTNPSPWLSANDPQRQTQRWHPGGAKNRWIPKLGWNSYTTIRMLHFESIGVFGA